MSADYLFEDAASVTPHDSTVQPKFKALYIGTSGDLKVTTASGNAVTFKTVPVGFFPLANAKLIWSTGTTAAEIIGLRDSA